MTLPLQDNDLSLERVLALGDSAAIGQYRVDLSSGRWWWSSETYRIHGFSPGEVVPTTAMVLAHKHPDDRERVWHVLEGARRTGDPFATVHRIVDAGGRQHIVSIVGQGRRDSSGTVAELVGYVIDLTGSVKRYAAKEADASIRAAAASRRDIEQAKAVIGLTLGLNDDEAFDVLREHSNLTNVSVRELSALVMRYARTTQGAPTASALTAFLRQPYS